MRYRDRATGQLIFAQEVRDRASGRGLPATPIAESKDKSGRPATIQAVFLPADQSMWDQFAFDLAMVDPLVAHPQPDYNEFSQELKESVIGIDDEWHQAWEIHERYATIEELRTALIEKVKNISALKRDAGIVVGTIPIRTDHVGVARITGAALGAKASRKFVYGDQSIELPKSVIDTIFVAVDDHIQDCYDRRADLTEEIKLSSTPLTIDLETGWP